MSLNAGFADPIFGSQSTFRGLMDALATPGEIVSVSASLDPPAGLGHAMAAVTLALCDFETKLFISDAIGRDAVSVDYLRFHTDTVLTSNRQDAQFALLDARAEDVVLAAFHQGTPEYPDRSTTLVVEVADLRGGAELLLTGPGLKSGRGIAPQSLPPNFIAQWAQNRAHFPLGVDLVLTAGSELLALPRSVHIIKGSR